MTAPTASKVARSAARCGVVLAAALIAAPAPALPPLENVVIYEANIRAMSPAGNLDGVTARLDHIAALGANTLWLMPIHPIGKIRRVGQLGSPYSPRDHLAVGSEYGTIEDLRELIAAAHARRIAVLLDWVGNHTSWDHAWIKEHPRWYSTDERGTIIHPAGTNWLDVADLNYDRFDMRSEMIAKMMWWVENTDIDGFRADAPDFIPHDFWSKAVPKVREGAGRPLLMLAEGARPDHFDAGFDLTFGWRFYHGLKLAIKDGGPAAEIARAHREEYAAVPKGRRVLRWTTNHDETAYDAPPPVLFGSLEASLAAYASMVMYGGTPLIYSGQEVGTAVNTPVHNKGPINWNINPGITNWYAWILGIRRQHRAIRAGLTTDRSTADTLMVARTLGDERVLAMINLRNRAVTASVPNAWASSWTDLQTLAAIQLEGPRTLQPYQISLYRLETWPGFVVAGALQTEQGDPADWDPARSSLAMRREGSRYTVTASNLVPGVRYALEIVTDRGSPPVNAADPRVASNIRAVGDGDGQVTITLDDGVTNNKGGPAVWIDTDAAALHVVGNFMNEAGGSADWNPSDPAFAMTPLGNGRYAYEAVITTPGGYVFKTTFGQGWNDQVGTDGYNDDALVQEFATTVPNQRVRLMVDLRARRLSAEAVP